MYITKKELLETTGISSSQLYRWKRQGLIPEEWFLKKAVKTGQETFLPREEIMERIAFIYKHKDTKSAEEMAKLLNTKPDERVFDIETASRIAEIHPDVLDFVKAGPFSRQETALLAIVSDVYCKYHMRRSELGDFFAGCIDFFSDAFRDRQEFFVVRAGTKLYSFMFPEGMHVKLDGRLTVVEHYYVDRLARQLEEKYPEAGER